MIVVDASVVASALADGGADGVTARKALRGTRMVLPDLIDIEVMSVLRRHWLSGRLDTSRFESAQEGLRDLPAERYPARPFLRRVFELRGKVTPYDAAYVALAEAMRCPLLTADRRLAAAPGIACEVRVLA